MFDAILPIVCLVVSITCIIQSVIIKRLKDEIKHLREQNQLKDE